MHSPELPEHKVLERLHRSQILWLPLVFAGGLPFVMGGLITVDPEGIFGWSGAIAFNLGFHVVAFLGISHAYRQFSYLYTGSPWMWAVPVGRWLLLFPVPVLVVGLLIVALATYGPLGGTWIGRLYSVRTDALRFPLWRKTGEVFRPTIKRFSWTDLTGRPPKAATLPEKGRGAAKREALSRLKLLFLLPEAGLLTWLVSQGIRWQPRPSTLVALMATAFGLWLGSLLLQAFPGLAEKLRWDRAQPLAPYLRSGALLLPAAGCVLGILGGACAAQRDIRLVGMLLKLLGPSFGVLLFASVFRNRLDPGLFLTWFFLYLGLEVLGPLLETSPALASRAVILALAAPVLGLVAGLALGPALLRPFTWRHLFDKRLPGGFRTTLAAVGFTAVLPLGGLAAPLWIWARERLWPRYGPPPRVETLDG